MDPNAPYVQVKISLHNLNHLCFVSVDFKRMNKNEYKIAGLVGLIHNEIIFCGGGFLTKKIKKKIIPCLFVCKWVSQEKSE